LVATREQHISQFYRLLDGDPLAPAPFLVFSDSQRHFFVFGFGRRQVEPPLPSSPARCSA